MDGLISISVIVEASNEFKSINNTTIPTDFYTFLDLLHEHGFPVTEESIEAVSTTSGMSYFLSPSSFQSFISEVLQTRLARIRWLTNSAQALSIRDFFLAVYTANKEKVEKYLGIFKNNANVLDEMGRNALYFSNDALITQLLISRGCDIRQQPYYFKITPLAHCALMNYRNSISGLAEAELSSPPSATGDSLFNPLYFCSTRETASKLIGYFPNWLHDRNSPLYRTPLFAAVQRGIPEIVQLFIDKGCNVNSVDTSGASSLFLAEDPRVIRMLVSAGCDPNNTDKEGHTALHKLCGNLAALTRNTESRPPSPSQTISSENERGTWPVDWMAEWLRQTRDSLQQIQPSIVNEDTAIYMAARQVLDEIYERSCNPVGRIETLLRAIVELCCAGGDIFTTANNNTEADAPIFLVASNLRLLKMLESSLPTGLFRRKLRDVRDSKGRNILANCRKVDAANYLIESGVSAKEVFILAAAGKPPPCYVSTKVAQLLDIYEEKYGLIESFDRSVNTLEKQKLERGIKLCEQRIKALLDKSSEF